MPIVIARMPDPTAPEWDAGKVGLAQSGPGRILVRSLARYLRGEISGRSVLIAGHRGAGKSTLVDLALRTAATTETRPLRVSLYGPNLFPGPRRNAGDPVAGADREPTAGKPGEPAVDGAQPSDPHRLLMELTVALYRSLAKEVAASFERTLAAAAPQAARARAGDILGQLTLELDEAPGPDRLRRFWEAVRVIDRGVLFPEARQQRPGQGMRELVALASAAQAFRVVAGRIDLKEESSRKADQAWSSSMNTTVDAKAVAGALLTLVSGLAGAAAVAFLGKAAAAEAGMPGLGWLGASLAAAIAAVSAKRTAKSTSGRSAAQSRSYTFIRDYKIETLARELPNLIDRVRDAGLSPVFVVDELDKVADVPKNLHGLVQELKPLVAERTFFCFIGDRDYYEYLRVQAREVPYAPEHTYFTHRLYVSYRPEGLRDFLARAITIEPGEGENEQTLDVERRALTYVVLFRARSHPFELSRQLQDFAAGSGERGLLERGAIRTDAGSLYALAYQVAVEAILQQVELASRANLDPYFGQLAYDALYYPADAWQRGRPGFELSESSLRAHLAARMRPGGFEFPGTERPAADGSAPEPTPETFDRLLGGSDLAFLNARVEELVGYLAAPRNLQGALEWLGIDAEVARLVPAEPLMVRDGTEVRFSHDVFRRPLKGLDATQRGKLQRLGPEMRVLNKRLTRITRRIEAPIGLGGLADDYGILDASPAWASVEPMLVRFERMGFARVPDEGAKDALAVIRYGEMLHARKHALGLGLACAGRLMRLSGAGVAASLSALSRLGRLSERDAGGVEATLRDASRELEAEVPDQAGMPLADLPTKALGDLAGVRDPEASRTVAAAREELWSRVLARIRAEAGPVANLWEVARADLVCSAAAVSPVDLLRSDLREMTIQEWTAILRYASENRVTDDPRHVPSWMAVVAAEYLGLRRAGFALDRPAAGAWAGESEAEAAQRLDLNRLVEARPAGKAPRCLAFVVAADASPALRWRAGERVAALVASEQDAEATMRALGKLVRVAAASRPALTRIILSEVPDRSIKVAGMHPFLRATTGRLVWDQASDPAPPSGSVVVGTPLVDDLRLPRSRGGGSDGRPEGEAPA